MNITVVDNNGEELKQVPQKEAETTPSLDSDLIVQSLGQMLDFRPNEIQRNMDNLKLLVDYARTQTSEKSPEAIKWAIRSLQDKIGSPPLGQTWLPWLSQYAYLKLETLKMQKEVEKYERD